jgi:hypothetical protein
LYARAGCSELLLQFTSSTQKNAIGKEQHTRYKSSRFTPAENVVDGFIPIPPRSK